MLLLLLYELLITFVHMIYYAISLDLIKITDVFMLPA